MLPNPDGSAPKVAPRPKPGSNVHEDMNDSDRKLAESLIQTQNVDPEEMEKCLSGRYDGETLVDALVRQGTIQTGELERVLDSLPELEEEEDNTFARAVKKIGRYRVISEIGRGGMGRVYLAYDPNLKRSVALKVMRIEELEDSARYRRETEIAAGLQHPNIGAIYDAQQEDETFVIAMQYIDGDSLDKARLDPREALKAIGEAARAVHFAHDHGIIHRDIKPENIMRTKDGRVFIMDFGVARRIERKASLTQTGTVIGTPMFMSPEQAAGRELDVRTDVYSLGATLYSLIAGRPPFVGASVLDIIQRIGKAEPPRLEAFHPDLHKDVTTIVQKSMRKERIRRYQTAFELAEDIKRYLSGEPIEARPMSFVEKGVRYLRKRPWMVNALLFLTLAVGVGGGLIWKEKQRETQIYNREAFQADRKAIRDLAMERLDHAKGNLDKWNRFLLFAPRDLSSKEYLLTEAVSLCLAARSLQGDDLAEADFTRARALFLLGRYREAERAIQNAISESRQDHFYLESARILLRRQVQPVVGVPLLHADLFAKDGLAEPAVQWFLKEISMEPGKGEYLFDLEQAEYLGRPLEERTSLPGIYLHPDYYYKRSRELCQTLLDRTPDPGHQADIHKVMAWAGYWKFLYGKDLSENVFLKTKDHIDRALEGKRSDAYLYLLQIQLAVAWGHRLRKDDSLRENLTLVAARGSVVEAARKGVQTALRIRPDSAETRILSAQLLAEGIEAGVWENLKQGRAGRESLTRILNEYVRPGEQICAAIVSDHPKIGMAWFQWILFQWQELLLERNLRDKKQVSLLALVDRLDQTTLRGLQALSEKKFRALLFFFRTLSSFMKFDLVQGAGEKEKVRRAFFSARKELRALSSDLGNQTNDLLDRLGGK